MQWIVRMRKWLEKLEDRRKSPRNPGDGIVAHYWTGGAPAPHRVTNVSLDGAYIQAADQWHTGTVVTLTFQLDPAHGKLQNTGNQSTKEGSPSLMIRSVVVNSDADGFSVHFLFMDHHERAGLRHFLKQAAGAVLSVSAAPQPNGQALIEFALVLPLLFLLIVNVVNFGAFIFGWITVANAARAGGDYLIMGGVAMGGSDVTGAQVQTIVTADASSLQNRASLKICTQSNNQGIVTSSGTCTGIAAPPPDPESPLFTSASVDVTYTFVPPIAAYNFPNLGIYLTLPSTTIHRKAVMRMEN